VALRGHRRSSIEARRAKGLGPSTWSAHTRFRRALRSGDVVLIRTAAAELHHVDLADALAVCRALHAADDPAYERAAVRFIGRLCLEAGPDRLSDVEAALRALQAGGTGERAAEFRRLWRRLGLRADALDP